MLFLNTDILLRWKLILKEFGMDIEYIQGKTNIVADVSSRFLINRIQEITHESTYKFEFLSEINDNELSPEVFFLINLKFIN